MKEQGEKEIIKEKEKVKKRYNMLGFRATEHRVFGRRE